MAARAAGDRPPGTPPPRRAADLLRHPRLPIPGLRHQHPGRATRRARGPAPRARDGERPDPLRQGHRLRPIPLPPLRDQRGLARTRAHRRRPDRLDPDPAPGRGTRARRAEEAALPAPARRRQDHPRTAPHLGPPRRRLALGPRPRRRLRPADADPATTASLITLPSTTRKVWRPRTPR